jgi:hypothetical protein
MYRALAKHAAPNVCPLLHGVRIRIRVRVGVRVRILISTVLRRSRLFPRGMLFDVMLMHWVQYLSRHG